MLDDKSKEPTLAFASVPAKIKNIPATGTDQQIKDHVEMAKAYYVKLIYSIGELSSAPDHKKICLEYEKSFSDWLSAFMRGDKNQSTWRAELQMLEDREKYLRAELRENAAKAANTAANTANIATNTANPAKVVNEQSVVPNKAKVEDAAKAGNERTVTADQREFLEFMSKLLTSRYREIAVLGLEDNARIKQEMRYVNQAAEQGAINLGKKTISLKEAQQDLKDCVYALDLAVTDLRPKPTASAPPPLKLPFLLQILSTLQSRLTLK